MLAIVLDVTDPAYSWCSTRIEESSPGVRQLGLKPEPRSAPEETSAS